MFRTLRMIFLTIAVLHFIAYGISTLIHKEDINFIFASMASAILAIAFKKE